MTLFRYLLNRKKEQKPRFVVEDTYKYYKEDRHYIYDTQEHMCLGLRIKHRVYDAGCIAHEESPNGDLNGVTTFVELVIGAYSTSPYKDEEGVVSFCLSGEALDKNYKNRLATEDDADFIVYTKLQKLMQSKGDGEKAQLMHTLLKLVDSNILTSAERISDEYVLEQKRKKQAEEAAKEIATAKWLNEIKEKERKEVQNEAEKKKQEAQIRAARVHAYIQNLKNGYNGK